MELNRKLTHLLKGCTNQSESGNEDDVAITFDNVLNALCASADKMIIRPSPTS
jgi:hypothetical protein